MIDYIPFGVVLSDAEAAILEPDPAAALLEACAADRAFTVLERRRWESQDSGASDVVVVDCVNDQVPSRNEVDIMVRERLALVLPRDPSNMPQVRALRTSFPQVMHLNHVPRGEPACLCLYAEPWAAARRTWTPQRFLRRVLSWLADTATKTLHRPGQAVEAMYFESPYDVVLPPNYRRLLEDADNVLVLAPVQRDVSRATFRGLVVPRAAAEARAAASVVAVHVSADTIVHGGVERMPETLGELSDDFRSRGSEIFGALRAEVARLGSGGGVSPLAGQSCLLILSVPTKRSADGEVERVDIRGFHLHIELWQVGVAIGALTEVGGKYYPATIIGSCADAVATEGAWRDIELLPLTVKEAVTPTFARSAASVPELGADDMRIIAGVGALGSALADLWSREGWGRWTLIDPDFVQPHNVVRHIARDLHVGQYKVDAVKQIVDSTYYHGTRDTVTFRGDILGTGEPGLAESLKTAALVVDASTTLEVPRELSRREPLGRCVSVFFTPSGKASVMLLEDACRIVRLDDLEAQYYAAIVSNSWGEDHLVGHGGELCVGAGCRDVSHVISSELVQMHASIVARQVRLLSGSDAARMRVWICNDETCQVDMIDLPVRRPVRQRLDAWTVSSHEGVADKLRQLRLVGLPAETGGVIIGYVDQPLRTIYVVDVLPSPADSERTGSGFVRGVEGLAETLAQIGERTAGIVGYLGEWHSHPPFNAPRPSGDDVRLLDHCTRILALEGDPALMMIVGAAGEVSFSLGMGAITR
jgi:integrative and conjugative element protein (TIGR02256 family)